MTKLLSCLLLSLLLGNIQAQETQKVLVIGIDGCRSDALLMASTPAIDGLISNGIFSPDGLNTDVTYSGPGWSAILTGVWSDKHLVTNNSFSVDDYATYPSFLKRIEDFDENLYTASICHWSPINTFIVQDYADHVVNFSNDNSIALEAIDQLQTEDVDAMFLHFDDVDHAGHNYGFNPELPEYIAAIEQTDIYVGMVLSALENRPNYANENWLILVTPDHGGIGTSHGGSSIEERTCFFIASGNSIEQELIEKETTIIGDAPEDCLGNTIELQFDGGNDFVEVAPNPLFNFGSTQDFTVECRVRTSQSADVAIVGNKDWDSGLFPGFVFSFQFPSGPEWKVNIGDGSNRVDLNAESAIADGQWHTLSVSFDRDGDLRMYEDGIFMGSADISGIGSINTGEGLFFGADFNNDYNYNGALSEVRLWNEVLSDAAIANYACSSLDGAHPNAANLTGYWKMNEGSGSSAMDSSGNNNNGTISGATWAAPQPIFEDDYSLTPRIADIPVTALSHLCIPIEESWNLDGQSWVPVCNLNQGDCFADINNDGLVNLMDLLALLADFGCVGENCTADLNGDGFVNTTDMISIMIPSYGLECPQ